jgi:cytochrome c oxidase assembly protein subunit 15
LANLSPSRFNSRLVGFAVILAFLVVVLGAFTRLTDAGLGCPDWPGCYGHLIVPETQKSIQQADLMYPKMPVVESKAWAEMVHRYAAGILALCIFTLTILAFRHRRQANQSILISILLVGVVLFQVVLGMWTVTLQLLPVVVMGHLLGGLTILSLLWLLHLSMSRKWVIENNRWQAYRPWAILGLIILAIQIALGGWTSTNYASLVCPDFPYCQGNSLVMGEFKTAFNVFMPLGANFDGGILDATARMTIQIMHRLGAMITGIYLLILSLSLLFAKNSLLRTIAIVLLLVLFIQISLGILNVLWLLPLDIAVAHNAFAALLLLTVVTLNFVLYAKRPAQLGK